MSEPMSYDQLRDAFASHGNGSITAGLTLWAEISRLRAEVAALKAERDALKEAGLKALTWQMCRHTTCPGCAENAETLRRLCAEIETGTEEKGSK